MGYQSGLTYQAVPYDWRKNIVTGDTHLSIPKSIRNLYEMTGKKIILFGHSYGSLQILNTLNNYMDKNEKDQKIRLFISGAAPFLGASSPVRNQMGGNPDIVKNITIPNLISDLFVGIGLQSQL